MKQIFRILPLAAILLLTACSKKTTTTVETPSDLVMSDVVDRVNANRNDSEIITGRVNLKLNAGKQKVEAGGNIKMKRNDVIQISLQVFGFVEAGRLELTRDYFLILNRIGKQYLKASYKDIPFFKDNGIDFYTLQGLIWNELFTISNKDNTVTPTTVDFVQKKEGENIILTNTGKTLVLKFLANAAYGTLQQTTLTAQDGANLRFDYESWARLGRKDFPDKMNIAINVDKTPIKAELELSRLRANEKWTDTRTNIDKKKLKQVSLQQVFNQILSLSN